MYHLSVVFSGWEFEKGFLCGTVLELFVDQAGLPQTHRGLPASASQVLGLKTCANVFGLKCIYSQDSNIAVGPVSLQRAEVVGVEWL